MTGRREFLASTGGVILTGVSMTGCLGLARSNGDEPYEFLISPNSDMSKYKAIANQLKGHLNREVKVAKIRPTEAQIRKLREGFAEFGETSTEVATTGARNDDIRIVLNRRRADRWDHDSLLITYPGSEVEEVSDLKSDSDGRKDIAFGGKYSAPASIYPLIMLDDAGVPIGKLPDESIGMDFDPHFEGTRGGRKALDRVINEEVEAAGVAGFVLSDSDNITILERRPTGENDDGIEIANSPVVVTPKLSKEKERDFVDAFPKAVSEVVSGGGYSEDGLWFNDARVTSEQPYGKIEDASDRIGHSYKGTKYAEIPEWLSSGNGSQDPSKTTEPPLTTDPPLTIPGFNRSTNNTGE